MYVQNKKEKKKKKKENKNKNKKEEEIADTCQLLYVYSEFILLT